MMFHRLSFTAVLLFMPLAAAWTPVCAGKSPQLPVDIKIICSPQSGVQVQSTETDLNEIQDLTQVRQLYQLADQFFQNGDMKAAHHFYQEVHVASPNSRYGQVAMEKLAHIERLHGKKGKAVHSATAVDSSFTSVVTPAQNVECSTPAQKAYFGKLSQAQEMFHIAERCRRNGDHEKAWTCYLEVSRICPQSDYARHSKRMLDRMKSGGRETETSAPPVMPSVWPVPATFPRW